MINKIIEPEKIKAVEEYLEGSDKIVIITHVSPDGDAIGSSLGLYHYLSGQGYDVNVIVPNSFPDYLKWLKGAKDILEFEKYPDFAKQLIHDADLMFCLDFNIPKRTSLLGPIIENAEVRKIMLDHHPDPSDFCDITISLPQISSTSEIVFRLICRMGDFDQMSKDSAEAIYMGMMTDTGGFTYNSNDPQIYYIIGELLSKGINKDQIYSNVYNNYSADRYRMLGFVLSERMKIFEEYNTALVWMTKAEQERYNAKKGDTEGFANLPLDIKGISFAAFFREDENMIKISFRSQGTFPCNQFAAECFNGGGHLNASGGEYFGSLDDALKIFNDNLPKYKDLLIK